MSESVTQQQEQRIRNDIDAWVQPSRAGSNDGCLHIADGDDPLCDRNLNGCGPMTGKEGVEYVRKDVAVFPLGYRDICHYCLEKWTNADD